MGDPSPWPHLRRVTRHHWQRRRHRSSKHTVPRSSRRRRRLQRGVYHITHLQTLLYKVLKPKGTWHGMFSHLMAWRKQGWHVEALRDPETCYFKGAFTGTGLLLHFAWRERIDWSVHVSSLVLISVQGLKISGSCSGPRIFGTSACHVLRQSGWHMVHQNSLALLNCPAKDIFPFPGVILWRNGSLIISLSAPTVVHERAFALSGHCSCFEQWDWGPSTDTFWHRYWVWLKQGEANGPASTVNYFSLKC